MDKSISGRCPASSFGQLKKFPMFFIMLPRRPRSTLFPYTTLFRSDVRYKKGDIDKPKKGVDGQIAFNYDWRDKHSESTRSEEHTSELQSQSNLVCRLLLEKKNAAHAVGSSPAHTPAGSCRTDHHRT